MGRKVQHHARLLEACFSRAEWEYLKRHKRFKDPLKKLGPLLNEFENICKLGAELLGNWEAANPLKPRFKRRQSRRPGTLSVGKKRQKGNYRAANPQSRTSSGRVDIRAAAQSGQAGDGICAEIKCSRQDFLGVQLNQFAGPGISPDAG